MDKELSKRSANKIKTNGDTCLNFFILFILV
jgi:hypothetical protein